MDAIRLSGLVFLSLFAVACSQTKTAESVFPTQSATGMCGKQASQNRFIVQWEDGRFTVESDLSADDFRHGFVRNNLALIKHVDHDYRIQLAPFEKPDINTLSSSVVNWGPATIQADQLWNQNIKGDGIVVAVVDGMVDTSHTQLQSNIFVNSGEIPNNGIDDDGNGFVDDYYGVQINSEVNVPSRNQHGTHVAGIIAADSNAGPVDGVAPRAKILPAQFIGNEPSNGQDGASGSIGDAIIAMNYAANRGAKIINMSWGVGPCIELPNLQASLQQLSNAGILLVTAAGNGDSRGVGFNVDIYPMYPSAYNLLNQINVAATTMSDSMIGFSNYGTKTVHIASPGVDIYSTVPGGYKAMSGTSMASPMTAGAAALIWSAIPSASATQVKQALMKGVDIVPGRTFDVASRGRLNVNKAYAELKKLTGN